MDVLERLKEAKAGIAALVLLGIGQLVAIDATANLLIAESMVGTGMFFVAFWLIFLFSAIVLGWIAIRAGSRELKGGILSGSRAGFAASVLVCIAFLALAFFGRGAARLVSYYLEGSPLDYALLCAGIVLFYSAMGALFGAFAVSAAKLFEGKKEAQK